MKFAKDLLFVGYSIGAFCFQTWVAQKLMANVVSVDYLTLIGLRFAYYCMVSNLSDYRIMTGSTMQFKPADNVKFSPDEHFVAKTLLKFVIVDPGMSTSGQIIALFVSGYFTPFILLTVFSLCQMFV